RSRERRTVYRFVPDADACNACRSHAAHRTYATMEAIQGDRAHEGCQCQILAEPVQDGAVMARFAGRTVVDDREG
ncbi:MAG TPA: hypothetical protein VEM93_01910, partial [Actinomycetota bacterium]|nr:hypothetical protein [Actinomycetota bacterium]